MVELRREKKEGKRERKKGRVNRREAPIQKEDERRNCLKRGGQQKRWKERKMVWTAEEAGRLGQFSSSSTLRRIRSV